MLGRRYNVNLRHELPPLDVRALGDLSAFPALCELRIHSCEAVLCESMLGAVRNTSLTSIAFSNSHPAPGCALTVLQLSQALRRLGRGSVLRLICCDPVDRHDGHALQLAHGLPPLYKFQVALQAYGM